MSPLFHSPRLFAAMLMVAGVAQLRAELPPEEVAAMKNGRQALEGKDYPLALRCFDEARRVDPFSPEVLSSLALAESKIPGHELRAAAWLGEYLAVDPKAQDAAAVKERIGALLAASRGDNARLIQAAQHAAGASGEAGKKGNDERLRGVAGLWAENGDYASAVKTIDLIHDPEQKKVAEESVAEALAKAGDMEGAMKIAGLVVDQVFKSRVILSIVEIQAAGGDIEGAQKNVALIQPPRLRDEAIFHIAEAQVEAGNMAEAIKNAALIQDAHTKDWMLASIAAAGTQNGDVEDVQKIAALVEDKEYKPKVAGYLASTEAQHTQSLARAGNIAEALKTAALIEPGLAKGWAESEVAIAQEKSGDAAGALKTADAIEAPIHKINALVAIAESRTKAGDMASARAVLADAQKSISVIPVDKEMPDYQDYYSNLIATAQGAAGDSPGAIKTAALVTETNFKSYTEGNIAVALADAGDIQGATEVMNLINNNASKSAAETAIAAAELKAGDIRHSRSTLAAARKTASLVEPADTIGTNLCYGSKSRVLVAIARVQIKAGDIAEVRLTLAAARKAADLMKEELLAGQLPGEDEDYFKKIAEATVTEAYGEIVPPGATPAPPRTLPNGDSEWMGMLYSDPKDENVSVNLPVILDREGFLKLMTTQGSADDASRQKYLKMLIATNSHDAFEALRRAAEKVMLAQSDIREMLRQETGEIPPEGMHWNIYVIFNR